MSFRKHIEVAANVAIVVVAVLLCVTIIRNELAGNPPTADAGSPLKANPSVKQGG